MTNDNQHLPAGYKPSPLGPIPEDWEVKRLGDCFEVSAGRDLEKDYFSPTKTERHCYPVFSNSLENKGLYGYTSRPRHKGNSITITGRGSLGHAEYRTEDYDAIIRLLVLTPKIEISCKLISDYINATSPFIYESTGVPQLTAPQIINTKLLLPPYKEQKKLVVILQLWDTAIEKQTALTEQLTLRKRGLMQQLLTGKKRLKGFSGEWKEVRLGEVFYERNETNCDDLPLLSITGDKGVIYQSESDKRDISNEDKSKYKRICPNDIGYNTMRMWQGRSALSELEGIVSPAYTIVTPKESVDARFMAMLIQQPRIVYSFWTHSQGLVSDTLNCKYPDFSQVKVTIPPKDEQTAVAEFLIGLNKEIELANKKLASLQAQKKGLMQVLLTGKRRINQQHSYAMIEIETLHGKPDSHLNH